MAAGVILILFFFFAEKVILISNRFNLILKSVFGCVILI